ncbi:hypothetical protein [Flavobacterium sp. B17]|uniref:hypothetical protein n=1 Tax=Flavobacterium sp. B17 TaxID=95618 RepID=UPI0003488D51|nr:hypothetical protein [Flavobacterium sp. B17]
MHRWGLIIFPQKATLDITAKTSGTKPEGLIIPQLAGNDIRTATTAGVYGTNQKGLIIFASSADTNPTRLPIM